MRHAHARAVIGIRSLAQAAVQRFVARHDDLGGEPLAGAGLRGAPEGMASRRVVDQAFQCLGERGDVTLRHEHAALAVLDDLRNAAYARGDARTAEAHGFEDAKTEALGVRGVEPDVGDLKIVLDRMNLLAHDHALGQAETPYVGRERRERLPGKDEEPERLARMRSGARLGRRGAKKLGMTSIGPAKSSTLWVSRLSDSDTAVTASDEVSACLMAGAYPGSRPSSVVSVPCSVVTTRGCRPGGSIARARIAAVA